MSSFIKKLLLFLLSALLLATALQTIISLRIKGKTVNGHDNIELTSGINADMVFLGSSRCWAHFNPAFFDTTYHLKSVNISVDGHSEIMMAIVRLNAYLSNNTPPKIAILSFDPFMSGDLKPVTDNPVHKDNYARYAFLPSKESLPIVDYFGFNFFERYVPMYAMFKYKHTTDAILLNNFSNWVTYGYERHDETWDTIAHPITDVIKKKYFLEAEEKGITESLDSLNKLCILHNIKLICIQTPVYKNIYDTHTFSRTEKICKSLSIPFIDANKDYIITNPDLFYNVNHLNTKGVNMLNDFLKNDSVFNSYISFIHKS